MLELVLVLRFNIEENFGLLHFLRRRSDISGSFDNALSAVVVLV
jgi:hypothetical protein